MYAVDRYGMYVVQKYKNEQLELERYSLLIFLCFCDLIAFNHL